MVSQAYVAVLCFEISLSPFLAEIQLLPIPRGSNQLLGLALRKDHSQEPLSMFPQTAWATENPEILHEL